MRAHVHLEVAFGSERLTTDIAFEGFLPSVSTHVNPQSASTREGFVAHLACMLRVVSAGERG